MLILNARMVTKKITSREATEPGRLEIPLIVVEEPLMKAAV